MSKSKEFIEQKCYQFGNPMQPVIFKADALEAVEIERKVIYEAYSKLCPCYREGICKSYPHNKERNTDNCDMDCKYIKRLENESNK